MSDVEGLAESVFGVYSNDEYRLCERILASPWLATRDQAARAEAWDEGYARGIRDEIGDLERADNPYRAAALRADDAGWMHSCGGRERWYPLGARCVACGRKFGDEH